MSGYFEIAKDIIAYALINVWTWVIILVSLFFWMEYFNESIYILKSLSIMPLALFVLCLGMIRYGFNAQDRLLAEIDNYYSIIKESELNELHARAARSYIEYVGNPWVTVVFALFVIFFLSLLIGDVKNIGTICSNYNMAMNYLGMCLIFGLYLLHYANKNSIYYDLEYGGRKVRDKSPFGIAEQLRQYSLNGKPIYSVPESVFEYVDYFRKYGKLICVISLGLLYILYTAEIHAMAC